MPEKLDLGDLVQTFSMLMLHTEVNTSKNLTDGESGQLDVQQNKCASVSGKIIY